MENNFISFIKITELLNETNALYLPENFDWVKSFTKLIPDLNLDLPKIEKKSKIYMVLDKVNPITVHLDDGSKLFFTHDEFRKINITPQVGKIMSVTLQRLPYDKSDIPSKIIKCRVF